MNKYVCAITGKKFQTTDVLRDTTGEAVIYKTTDPGMIAKIYKPGHLTPAKEQKLRIMVSNPPADPAAGQGFSSIAWPKHVLLTDSGKEFKGFLMPFFSHAKTLQAAMYPSERKLNYPRFDWENMHIAAINTASIFGAVHERGYVIGDVKDQNLMIDDKSHVAIIDTDSFQVRDPATGKFHFCPVYSPDFMAAEVAAKALIENRVRAVSEDLFGLGVILHYLLVSHHPFWGTWNGPGEPEIGKAIQGGHFLYAPWSKMSPGDRQIPLTACHPKVMALFKQCFVDGYKDPSRRPDAGAWRSALISALSDFQDCPQGHLYFPASANAPCPWCERKKRLNSEPFPKSIDGRRSRLRRLARDLCTALDHDQERDAIKLWQANKELHNHDDLKTRVADITALEKEVAAFDKFAAALQSTPQDIAAVLALWTPAMESSTFAGKQSIGDIKAVDIVADLRDRRKAIDALAQAINTAGSGPYTEAHECAIIGVWKQYESLLRRTNAPGGVVERVKAAGERVARFAQLANALRIGDERKIVETWGPVGLMDRFAPVQQHRARVDECRRILVCVDEFEDAAAKVDADDEVIWKIWQREPGNDTSLIGNRASAKLSSIAPAARAKLARARLDAIARVYQAIALANAPSTEAMETSIVAAWDTSLPLLKNTVTAARFGVDQRVAQARHRLEAGRLLPAAISQDEETTIAQAWGDGQILLAYAPTLALRSRAEQAVRCVRQLDALEVCFTADPQNDAKFINLWSRSPDLPGSKLADVPRSRLGQRTPRQVATLANRRLHILLKLTTAWAVTPPDTQSALAVWDEGLCRTHPAFASFLRSIDQAKALRDKFDKFSPILEHGNNSEICKAWDPSLSVLADVQKNAPRIIRAFQEHDLAQIVLREALLHSLVSRAGILEVRWDSAGKSPELCIVAVRSGTYPAIADDVALPSHRQECVGGGSASIKFDGHSPHVCVWAAIRLFGHLILHPNPLRLMKDNASEVRYRVRHVGSIAELYIETDASELPELVLIGAAGYPPQRDDSKATEIQRIKPTRSRNLTLKLPGKDYGKGFMIRLYPGEKASSQNLRFVHPAGKEAMLGS